MAEGNGRPRSANGRSESVIRPERFARLVTLAGLLIGAAREQARLPVDTVLDELNVSRRGAARGHRRAERRQLRRRHLRALRARSTATRSRSTPDTYGDNFARPARLLPLEAKALVAAIDLFGDHLPQAGLGTAREKIVAALGHDPSQEGLEIAPGRDDSEVVRTVNDAIERRRVLELHYYKENEDEFVKREVEPYQLVSGPEGWYLGCYDLGTADTRHFRLDRMKEARLTRRSFEPREGVGGAARRAGVAGPRRGRQRRRGPRLGLAGAGPLAARGAHRGRGARRRVPSWSSCPTAPPTGSCARSSRASGTWSSSSRRTLVRPCSRQ